MIRNWITAGWPIVRIRDIGRLHGGGTPSRKRTEYFQGTIPWITGQDIPESHVAEISTARDYVTDEAVQESATRVVPAGAVLVTTRVSVGKTAVAGRDMCFSQDVTAILIYSPVIALPAYVAHFLRSRRDALLQKNQGSTIAGITRDSLALEQIPLPPLSEQKRIVEILQEVEEIRRLRTKAEAKTAELIPATFFKFFGDKETHFENVPLRELVHEFKYGTSQSSGDRGTITLRIPNILGNRISFDDLVRVDEKDESLERLRLQTGDMLFVRTNGNPEYIGRCCVFEETDAKQALDAATSVIFASYLIRARLRSEKMHPWFLHAYLRSPLGRARVLKQARTAAGQYNINTEGLGAVRVPVPSRDLQEKFLKEATEAQQIAEIIRGSERQMAALGASLSAHAFSGQLTANWREAHKDELAIEARERDAALKETGALSTRVHVTEFSIDAILEERTDGIYSDLNREQRLLLREIKRMAENERMRYFTAEQVARFIKGPLHRHPQKIESHLAVFAVRGIIIPVSRPRSDSVGPAFAGCYRLPMIAQPTFDAGEHANFDVSADDIRADLMETQRRLSKGRN